MEMVAMHADKQTFSETCITIAGIENLYIAFAPHHRVVFGQLAKQSDYWKNKIN